MLDLAHPTITDPKHYAEAFPGFPPFIHHIMAHIAAGKTPEEAAELVDAEVMRGNIDTCIEEIEHTHAKFDSMGNIEVPDRYKSLTIDEQEDDSSDEEESSEGEDSANSGEDGGEDLPVSEGQPTPPLGELETEDDYHTPPRTPRSQEGEITPAPYEEDEDEDDGFPQEIKDLTNSLISDLGIDTDPK